MKSLAQKFKTLQSGVSDHLSIAPSTTGTRSSIDLKQAISRRMKSELFSSVPDRAAEHASEYCRRLSDNRAESEVSHCMIFVGCVRLYYITFGHDFKLPNYSVLDLFKFPSSSDLFQNEY